MVLTLCHLIVVVAVADFQKVFKICSNSIFKAEETKFHKESATNSGYKYYK